MAKCSDTCACRNLVCAITFLVIGIVFVVAGGVIAAVGFGTRPKDMFDNGNLSMRIVGLVLAGAGILPIIMGALFAFFYCGHKRGKFPGRKAEIKNNVEMNVFTKERPAWTEYPYPSQGGSVTYKPGPPPPTDSVGKYEDYEKDDSFTIPLNRSEKSFNNGGVNSSNIYSEVKESEMAGVTTRTTTTTHTKVYKTGTLESATGSGSSGVASKNENAPKVKAKRPKKQTLDAPDSVSPSVSSGVPSFNEGDVPLQKAKRPKKHKKRDRSGGEEVFEDTDEPLPSRKYRSDGSDNTDIQRPVPKPRHSAASPSFDDEDDTPSAPVYGRVHKKRERNLY